MRTTPRILLVLALTYLAAAGDEKIKLEPRTEKGRKTLLSRSMELVVSGEMQRDGKKFGFSFKQDLLVRYTEEVLDVADGKATRVSRAYDKHEASTTQTVAGAAPRSSVQEQPVVGKTVTLVVKDGHWVLDPPDAALDTVFAGQKADTGLLTAVLPDAPVAVGESWAREGAAAVAGLNSLETGVLRCTLAGMIDVDGRKAAKIAIELTGSGKPNPSTGLGMSLKGDLLFDVARGEMIRAELEGPMTLATAEGRLSGRAKLRLAGEPADEAKAAEALESTDSGE